MALTAKIILNINGELLDIVQSMLQYAVNNRRINR